MLLESLLQSAPQPHQDPTFPYHLPVIHNYPGTPVSGVSFLETARHLSRPTLHRLASSLPPDPLWERRLFSCCVGMIYYNPITDSLEDCNTLMRLSPCWEFKDFQEGIVPADMNTPTV